MKGQNLIEIIDSIAVEKKIDKEIIINSIKDGFIKSFERKNNNLNVKVDFDEITGNLKVYEGFKVIESLEDEEENSILLKDAILINKNAKVNDVVYKLIDTQSFNRMAALQVSQILRQQIREAEKRSVYQEYKDNINQIMTGKIITIKDSYYLIQVGRTFAFLPRKNMLPNDNHNIDDEIKFYVEDISETSKNSGQILASRTNDEFLKKLLEQEIPEIFENIVQIKSIAREPGIRSKISVYTENSSIDPIGTCVGFRGARIKNIINELNGENIDVCKWSENKEEYIRNVFSIVNILHLDEVTDNEINLIIPREDLSLAIGKKGRTIKLCANLLNLKINILSLDDPKAIEIMENAKSKKSLSEDKIIIEPTETTTVTEQIERSVISATNEDIAKEISTTVEVVEDNKEKEIEKEIEISNDNRNLFLKYKAQFNALSEKISVLNDKKYDENLLVKEIKLKFIDLYQYFNDYDAKTITNSIFEVIKSKINIKSLKKYNDFIDCDLNNEDQIDVQHENVQVELPTSKLNSNEPEKIGKIDEELDFYKEVETNEQNLDDEYYDNIDYDDYDKYYD